MYSREKVELFLLATEDGMGPTAAAKFAGVSVGAAKKWATGHLPHSYTVASPPSRRCALTIITDLRTRCIAASRKANLRLGST